MHMVQGAFTFECHITKQLLKFFKPDGTLTSGDHIIKETARVGDHELAIEKQAAFAEALKVSPKHLLPTHSKGAK